METFDSTFSPSSVSSKPDEWTPILNGDIFCSKACGGKCKKSDYDLAVQSAAAMIDMVGGNGWIADVWENLGWYSAIKKGCAEIWFQKDRGFKALIRTGPDTYYGDAGTYYGESSHPLGALENAISKTREHVGNLSRVIASLTLDDENDVEAREAEESCLRPSIFPITPLPALNTHSSIRLRSGAYFNFLKPETSVFTIDDIAHALSHVCRFTGHTLSFYSVAQHSVLVSEIVPPEHALAGLLHDSPEAFIGDVAKPLKMLLPDYAEIEARVERVVLGRFGLPAELPACVKQADIIMLRTEQRDVMGCEKEIWYHTDGEMPLLKTITPWAPDVAKAAFLDRYYELIGS